MSGAIVLFVGNTTVLEVALVDKLTGNAINGATVTVTLTDIAGNTLAGESWPKALAYVAQSEGIYRAYLSSSVSMEEGANYLYEAAATVDGMTGRWSGDVNAMQRSF